MTDPYAVLGVTHDASPDEIKKAYRSLVKQYHPDLHPNDEEAAKRMSEINSAYDMIRTGKDSSGKNVGTGEAYSTYSQEMSGMSYEDLFSFFGGEAYARADIGTAEQYIRAGMFFEALTVLEGIGERDARWYYLSALASFRVYGFERAEAYILTAIELDPNNIAYAVAYENMKNIQTQNDAYTSVFYQRKSCLGTIIKIFLIVWFLQLMVSLFAVPMRH